MVGQKGQNKWLGPADIFKKTERISSEMFLHQKVEEQRSFQLGHGSGHAIGRLKIQKFSPGHQQHQFISIVVQIT